MAISASLVAGTPFQPTVQNPWKKGDAKSLKTMQQPRLAADEIPSSVVIDEDFSNFKAGTEAAPDEENIGGPRNRTYNLKPGFTKLEGWTGTAIHQAGGTCAITSYYDEYY